MRISTTPTFELSFARLSKESMRGLLPPLEQWEGEEQLPQDEESPMVLIAVRCREGRGFSTAYQDKKFLKMTDLLGVYSYQTAGRRRLLDRLRKAAERAQKRADAEAAIEAERVRKIKLIKRIQQEQEEFDRLARESMTRIEDLDPARLTDQELDELDLIKLEVLAGPGV